MFSKGQLIFAVCFFIVFFFFMIWSYRKDIKNIRSYYKNTAVKVGFWIVIAVFLFSVIRIYTKS